MPLCSRVECVGLCTGGSIFLWHLICIVAALLARCDSVAWCADDLSFHHGRPVAAVLIFRSCLQWKVFQADRTVLFDKIINTMGSQIERQQDNNACLSYWLSNTVTLLYLLQRNIKPASGGSYNSRLR